jgi:hypothetical protein
MLAEVGDLQIATDSHRAAMKRLKDLVVAEVLADRGEPRRRGSAMEATARRP